MPPQRNPLLSVRYLDSLRAQFRVEMVMTPWERVYKVPPDATVADARQTLEARHNEFDQLGVKKSDRWGLLRKTSLEGKDGTLSINGLIEWFPEVLNIDSQTELIQALKSLAEPPCALVASSGSQVIGLVHRSDFNKQAVRIYLYLWISALEMGLAELINRTFSKEDDWIGLLGDRGQRGIRDGMNKAKKQDARLTATEYANLSDLVNVVTRAGDEQLWQNIGYDRPRWEKESGIIVELRKSIMHPAKTLIRDSSSAQGLIDSHCNLKSIVKRLETFLISGSNRRL